MPEDLGMRNGEKSWQMSKEKEELMVGLGFADLGEKS